MIIVRIRSSAGILKVTVNSDCKIADLKEALFTLHKIPSNDQIFASDVNEDEKYSDGTVSLTSLGITNGTIVRLLGRVEKEVVAKSFISENGEVIKQGTVVLKLIQEESLENDEGKTQLVSNSEPPLHSTATATLPQQTILSEHPKINAQTKTIQTETTHIKAEADAATLAAAEFAAMGISNPFEVEEDFVREADAPKRMVLAGDSSPVRPALSVSSNKIYLFLVLRCFLTSV